MALESADQIWELVPTNPESGDPVAEGDNHLRMIKLSLQNSLPGMTAPWTTSSPINCGDPVVDQDAVTLKYLNTMPHNTGIGFPIVWLLPALPSSDHLDLEGQLLNRIDYAELFALYGITYGAGDGTTTFQLPDMRGLFMRVWDHSKGIDPDSAARTNRGDGVVGDFVGTKQEDALQEHSHGSAAASAGSHPVGGGTGASSPDINDKQTLTTGTAGNYSSETRPINIYVRMIIRAK